MEQNNNLPVANPYAAQKPATVNFFADVQSFEMGQRMCHLLASSSLVPDHYQGNIANTMIALEMANRTGASPFMVMQNLYVVHGRPAWSAQFIIAVINACGRFDPLHYDTKGEGDDMRCRAWAIEKATGERLEGPEVSIKMAKAEGWWSKKDRYGKETSKWQSMPEVMLGYRAAAFFGRRYAPDILMGMQCEDEILDVAGPETAAPAPPTTPPKKNGNGNGNGNGRSNGQKQPRKTGAAALNAMLNEETPAPAPETKAEVKADAPEQVEPPAAPEPAEPATEAEATPTPEQASIWPAEPETPPAAAMWTTTDDPPAPEAPHAEPAAADFEADFDRAMQHYLDKLDKLETRADLDSWPERQKNLADDLGGEDSEWYRAVMDYWRDKIGKAKVSK